MSVTTATRNLSVADDFAEPIEATVSATTATSASEADDHPFTNRHLPSLSTMTEPPALVTRD